MDWIDDIITGLIEVYGTDNVYELYDLLEIQIIKLNKDNILLRGNDGFYQRNYFNQEIVFISDDLDYKYEKVVLGHELGHAILHTQLCSAGFNTNLINSGKIERQATYFALRLLSIDLDPIDLEGMSIEQISMALHVPKDYLILI